MVVVGASLAGLRACEAFREGGFDGRLVLVGAETHLPYDRPPLSKQLLAGKFDVDRVQLRTPERLDALAVEMLLGTRATSLDAGIRRITLEGGSVVGFDGLVIATGATPRLLAGLSRPLPDGVFTLRTLDDSLALRDTLAEPGAKVVVIGAGFIGSEVASTASGRGADVTVLEAMPVPLAHALGEKMGRACASLHSENGVTLRTGAEVAAVEGGERVERVVLADGSVLAADVVVVAVGVSPETSWLAGSGLDTENGVGCDASLLTAPGIAAAGDIARWPHAGVGREIRIEHWENASLQGTHAAETLLKGEAAEPFAPVPYFWSDQYGVKIQLVGYARPDDEVVVVDGAVAERRFVACYGRERRLTAAIGFNRPRHVMEYRKLIVSGASFEEALRFQPD
jgi:NADPH-dependent 2,4-dienoyl-CoA reductase/sulfur reductase-like enzyme